MISHFNRIIVAAFLTAAGALAVAAQVPMMAPPPPPVPTPSPTPPPQAVQTAKGAPQIQTAEQVAETSVFYYGFPGYATVPLGRERLNQIRKTTLEHGRIVLTAADGKTEQATYQRFVIRGENLFKEKIRLDQDLPTVRYSLIFNDDKIFGIFNNTIFAPREDASKMFESQIAHGLEALLRYKENESALLLGAREKVMGVDYYVLDVTDKQSHKTRFYISAKTFRVMMLTYEEGGVKYKRKFYDYNYAQGTLVPYRSVLWANDKQIEETEIGTVTFGQKVDEGLFSAS